MLLSATPVQTPGVALWLQFVMQAGALGILALIAWKLPTIIRELKAWRTESEAAHATERGQWLQERDVLRQERDGLVKAYREEAKYEREECSKHFLHLAQLSSQSQTVTQDALDKLDKSVQEVGQSVALHDALARSAMQQVKAMHDKAVEDKP